MNDLYNIKITKHGRKRMQERYFRREVILHLIKNINSDDFKEFLASEYIYLAVRDTKKKKVP